MKKFIKGTYQINDEIVNLDEFAEQNDVSFKWLIKFANNNDISFNIGTSNDGDILCEYSVVKRTLQECKSAISEFKKHLKKIFKKVDPLYEGNGDKLF